MVRGKARDDHVEAGVGKRQARHIALLRADVVQAALHPGAVDHVEHGLRQVIRDDRLRHGSDGEAGVAGAAAQVQYVRFALLAMAARAFLHQHQVGALRVYRAAQVGIRRLAKLFGNDIVLLHGFLLLMGEFLQNRDKIIL